MKKLLITCAVLFVSIAGFSQHLSFNAFGGYTFRDRVDFSNAYAYVNAGGMWGVSVEGVGQHGAGLELLYQYQSTDIPVYKYPSGIELSKNSSSVISYLLLNFEQYMLNNPKIQPYGGLGLGAAFYKGSDPTNSSSATKFAWDLKAGVKFKFSDAVGVKIGAQLLSSAQASGTYFYYGYAYTAYTSILQFGFTGGLVFDFGGRH
jgi:opacity protein-like surface antigen